MSKLYIIGIGPGGLEHLTIRAKEAIGECEAVIGYKTYVGLIDELLCGKEVLSFGMTEEIARARKAVEFASAGKTVGLISGGDPGVYGMAGLALETLKAKGKKKGADNVSVEVIPGVSALNAAASLLGAPLGHDFAAISLSDLLTEWETILRRVRAAAEADFIIALYNPKSKKRTAQIEKTMEVLLEYRPGNTPVGIVNSAYREGESVVVTDLDNMLSHKIGMLTTIIVGNGSTFVHEGKMITPRGYHKKYEKK